MDPNTQSADSWPTDKAHVNSPRRSWRPQVSLATFLCLVTIVALGFSHFLQSQKYSKLKTEHDKLRKDLFLLDIKDPDVIHAIGLLTHGSEMRRIRFYLPPHKNYMLHYANNGIPKEGFDVTAVGSLKIPPGTFSNGIDELWIQIRENRIDVNFPGHGWGIIVSPQQLPEGKVSFDSTKRIIPQFQTDGERGEPFLIERLRKAYFPPGTRITSDDYPEKADGLMLWIEEVPSSSSGTVPANTASAKTEN